MTKSKSNPVVKYHKDRKSGIRYKRTLLLTLEGQIAKTLSNRDIQLYWTYDTKKNKLEIYDEIYDAYTAGLMAEPKPYL